MPATPQNTVDTLFVDYTIGGDTHTMQFHTRAVGDPSTIDDLAQQFINALGPAMHTGWAVTGTRLRVKNTNFTVPIAPLTTPTTGAAPIIGANEPRFVSFVGRSNTGKRTRITVYGLLITEDESYRIQLGDNTSLDAARAVLATSSGAIGAVDGSAVTWYAYMNWGYNAYHQRKNRRE